MVLLRTTLLQALFFVYQHGEAVRELLGNASLDCSGIVMANHQTVPSMGNVVSYSPNDDEESAAERK